MTMLQQHNRMFNLMYMEAKRKLKAIKIPDPKCCVCGKSYPARQMAFIGDNVFKCKECLK